MSAPPRHSGSSTEHGEVEGRSKARIPVVQQALFNHDIQRLTNEELSEIIANCEGAIADGTAEIEDYEAFVLCQKELARRTWA